MTETDRRAAGRRPGTPPHVVVFEPEAGGHQMDTVHHLLTDLVGQLEVRLTLVTTEDAAGHPNTQRLAQDLNRWLTVRVALEPSKGHPGYRILARYYEEQWRWRQMAKDAIHAIGPGQIDFFLLPHLESIGLMHLGMHRPAFAGLRWATVAMGLRCLLRMCGIDAPRRWIDSAQKVFLRRLLRDPTLVALGTMNPYVPKVMHDPKVRYCPEPSAPLVVVEMSRARRAYGLRMETFVVLVFGVIDRRKCLDLLLAGAARVPPDIDLTVLVAGAQAKNEVGAVLDGPAARILRQAGRLVEVNRFIVTGQDIDPMNVADAVWVFYDRSFVYGSSVLVHAGMAGCPVIARRQGLIGRQVEDYGCGLVLGSGAPETVAGALTRLGRDPALRRRLGEAGRQAFAGHTPHAFARPLTEAMLKAMGHV